MKRPAFWILLGLVSLAATAAAVHYFPQAFSIVALDITMTRERALAEARAMPMVTEAEFNARQRAVRSAEVQRHLLAKYGTGRAA